MSRVRVGIQKTHRHRLDAVVPKLASGLTALVLVQCDQCTAGAVQTFRNLEDSVGRDRTLGLHPGVYVLAAGYVVPSDLKDVLESLCGKKANLRRRSFDNRVGRNRRAVEDALDVRRVCARLCNGVPDARHEP